MRVSKAQLDLTVATEESSMLAFLDSIDRSCPLLDQLAPLTGQIPQLPDRLRRDEVAAQKAVLELANPQAVHHVVLAT
jgi:hypothetical protein